MGAIRGGGMQVRLNPLAALVLVAALVPATAAAGTLAFAPALAAFDLRTTALPDADEGGAHGSAPVRAEENLPRREKVKIRWTYQPAESGPQFEVGTYGSRKGVMRSKLLHVAMDWSF